MIDFIKAEKAFKQYLKQYDLEDGRNKLKVVHTYEVVRMSEYIASKLGLSEEDIQVAKLVALLHDIGRFEQVKLTEGFIDNQKFDHADYGAEMLFKQGMIRQFVEEDKYDNIIEKAVYNHNKLKIEDGLNEKEFLQCQIVRDADKIDNFRVSEKDPIGDVLACPYNAESIEYDTISPSVFETFMEHRMILNTDRKTMIDYWICIIAFIFDMNFDVSLQYIKENTYIDKIIDRINYKNPDTKQKIEQIRECTKKYLERK